MMLTSSFVVASLTHLLLVSASDAPATMKVKRDIQSTLSAATTLNTALALQICIIAEGSFKAAAALGSTKTLSGICASPTLGPVPIMLSVKGIVMANYPSPSYGGYYLNGTYTPLVGTVAPQSVDSNGVLQLLENAFPFYFPSLDGTESGIPSPFFFNYVNNINTNFGAIMWNTTFNYNPDFTLMTLSDPNLHLCDKPIRATTDKTCSTNVTLSYYPYRGQ